MMKIILWNGFSYLLNQTLLLGGNWLEISLPIWRIHLFFHLFSLVGTVWIFLNWNAIRYTLTNTQIVLDHGILNIDRDTFLFRNIECVKLHKNLIGRIFSYGTIEMYAPTLQEHVLLRNVGKAQKYAKLIQKSIAQQRRTNVIFPTQDVGMKMRMA
jgi:uncharacterized membrane protein YdbT with pleckstrin-like domain